ncbi:hypothetical protein GCM10010193_55200 [Kitasatospora atroaurantiaca]
MRWRRAVGGALRFGWRGPGVALHRRLGCRIVGAALGASVSFGAGKARAFEANWALGSEVRADGPVPRPSWADYQ